AIARFKRITSCADVTAAKSWPGLGQCPKSAPVNQHRRGEPADFSARAEPPTKALRVQQKTQTESEVTSYCAGSIASFGTQRFERLDVCGASRREKTGKHRRCSQQGTGYD